MKTKIIPIIGIFIFLGAIFWIAPIFKNRYFEKTEENVEQEKTNTEKIEEEFSENDPEEEVELDQEEEDLEAEKDLEEEKDSLLDSKQVIKDTYLDIAKEDCDNSCKEYKNDKEDLKYCQEVCGLILSRKDVEEDDCEDEEGLDQDYCLRDLAIIQKDFKICDKIEDEKITENCKNRITEDIIDTQKME